MPANSLTSSLIAALNCLPTAPSRDEEQPSASGVTCSGYQPPKNAKPMPKDTYVAGEKIFVECKKGYILLQNQAIICEESGKFSKKFAMCLPGTKL